MDATRKRPHANGLAKGYDAFRTRSCSFLGFVVPDSDTPAGRRLGRSPQSKSAGSSSSHPPGEAAGLPASAWAAPCAAGRTAPTMAIDAPWWRVLLVEVVEKRHHQRQGDDDSAVVSRPVDAGHRRARACARGAPTVRRRSPVVRARLRRAAGPIVTCFHRFRVLHSLRARLQTIAPGNNEGRREYAAPLYRRAERGDHPHSLNPHTWHFTHPSAYSS